MRRLLLMLTLVLGMGVNAQVIDFNCNKYAPTIESITRSDSTGDYIHGTTARFEVVAYDQDGTRPTLSYSVDGGEMKSIEYFEANEENHHYFNYSLSSKGIRNIVVYASDDVNTTSSTISFEVLAVTEECTDAYSYEYLLHVATEIGGNIASIEDCTYGPMSIWYIGEEGTTYKFRLLYFADGETFSPFITIDTETEEITIGE